MIHLDTSFLIRALVPGSPEAAALRGWIGSGRPFGISALAWTEFLCGPLSGSDLALASTLVGPPAPYGAAEAAVAARLFNASGRRRGTLVDCMVAATALEHGAELATSNVADFRRMAPLGVRLAT